MIQTKNFWTRRVDKFLLLLIFFSLILSFLFLYLQKIDGEIKNYDNYHQKLEKLVSLEHQMENFFLRAYRYIDYDEASLISNEFEESLDYLQKSNIKKEFGQHIYKHLKDIRSLYEQKLQLLERFKTLNSRVTNSIHYLYDLRKTIDKKNVDDSKEEELLDQIFFTIGQLLMDLPFDQKKLNENMAELKLYSKEHQVFGYFYQHSKQFFSDSAVIKKKLVKNSEIKLFDTITHAMHDLSNYYDRNRKEQKIITFFFFIFAFLILIILVFNYQKVRRTTRELQAFRYAIENSDNGIVITDKDRHIQYVNEAFELHTGYMKDEVLGENPNILKSDLLNDNFYKEMNETLDRGEKWQGELINRRKDGTLLYEKSSIVPIFLEGELVEYLAIKLDITDYKEQQQKLQQSVAVYETIGDGIMITDSEQKILSINPAFIQMFGYEEEELIGQKPMMISSLKQDRAFYKRMWYSLTRRDRWTGKIYNKTKSGKVLPIWLTITVMRDKIGAIANFIAIYTNLEEIIEMEEKVNFLAYHDSLTHLPNRAHFEREIVRIFDFAKTHHNKIAILFIDLDRFKVINDTLGHHIGDKMLVYLADRIKNILRKDDLFARIGGDEFVIILDPLKTREDAVMMAEKILTVIREPIQVQNYHLNTTASIGIALYPDDGDMKTDIIKHADSAMYYAKEKGKDRYEFYTEQLSIDIQMRLDLEQQLKHALEKKELYVYYQPQYDLQSGKVSGAEALLRWYNPSLGQVPPDQFISVAEETGMIIGIGYFIFEEACREYMHWIEQGLQIDTISINISSVQFREDDLLENFKKLIEKTGISPQNIEIEITERFIMEYSTTNLTILEGLRNIGCKISIDDFGTGYSSMNYMKSLPLDTIKIDKSFVMDLPHDNHDAEVSKAIIALSKSLGYHVVAEGIENEAQEVFLRENGCDIGQGYYFAKPMDASAFVAFVKEKNQ
jgi:diguanylate cyclase (GGDEF)-like protein/PAS domain S-box-containing protein